MKLIEFTIPETKTVKYFGLTLVVPVWANYLACDEDGELFAYSAEPERTKTLLYWRDLSNTGCQIIAKVDLEGLDFRQSLVKL